MIIKCVWEHNGEDTLLYAENFIGAFTRGKNKEEALQKMPYEVQSYLKWCGSDEADLLVPNIVAEKQSGLNIADADTDIIFRSEKEPLLSQEYFALKQLAIKSAEDFLTLYNAVPDKNKSCLHARKTFYGSVPITANEMYEHTKNVNDYYFGEIGVKADHSGTIAACRKRGFELLESDSGFLENKVLIGSYGEEWSLKKVLRRFIWHDRIHAKAMYRMAVNTFGESSVPNIFRF